jgi:leucyl aminopeptidase
MQISFASPGSIGPGALVLSVQDGGALSAQAARYDEMTSGALTRAIEVSRFKGQAGQSIEVLAPAGVKSSRIVLAGVGKGEKFDGNAAERLAATVAGRLLASGEQTLTFALDPPKRAKLSEAEMAAHLATGAYLRSYSVRSLPQGRRRRETDVEECRHRDQGRGGRAQAVGGRLLGCRGHLPRPRSRQRAAQCSAP